MFPSRSNVVIYQECAVSMGFPISDEHDRIASAASVFTHGHLGCPQRSRRSSLSAVGNTMHVNSVGAVLMTAVIRYAGAVATHSAMQTSLPEPGADGEGDDGDAATSTFREAPLPLTTSADQSDQRSSYLGKLSSVKRRRSE